MPGSGDMGFMGVLKPQPEDPGSTTVWVTSGGSTSIMAVTAGFSTLLGYDPADVVGKGLHTLCNPISDFLVVRFLTNC